MLTLTTGSRGILNVGNEWRGSMRHLRETHISRRAPDRKTNTLRCVQFSWGCLAFAVSHLFTFSVYADEFTERRYTASEKIAKSLQAVDVAKSYALGVGRFDLDHRTEIIGWQLANSWYLGRQDGLDSGLTLVWQQSTNQVSVSKEGVRLTRRF